MQHHHSEAALAARAGCARRSAADLSAVASVYTPLAVYSVLFKAYPGHSPWVGFGGTSLSSPLIAGMFALAGNAASRHGATEIWEKHTAFNDVVTGTNVSVEHQRTVCLQRHLHL